MTINYETVIGLEVHVQVNTRSKLFCSCKTDFGAPPNSQVCPICTGQPGVLPVLNQRAVELLVKTGLALGATIAQRSKFDRKNYFYPDLPKNYQISQFDMPLSKGGHIDIEVEGKKKTIGLTRIHLEEDAGKNIHSPQEGGSSLVDFNRTGIPLMEMVSEPDIRNPEEAFEYLRVLKQILLYLGVSDCNMEEGSLRCDANVSVRPEGQKEFGTKVEIKNMNSFSNVRKALAYEVSRQIRQMEDGGRIVQETRLWDVASEKTVSMRSKESAHDYRYFPEPDLVPIMLDRAVVEKIRLTLPELPASRKERFVLEYHLPEYDAGVLTSTRELADYFERCVKLWNEPKSVGNWIMTELLKCLNEAKREVTQSPITPENLAGMLKLMKDGILSGKMAKDLFQRMFQTGKAPETIVKEEGLVQITDESGMINVVREVLTAAPSVVVEYKKGKVTAIGFFVGQVMKKTQGKANPQMVNKLLKEELDRM